MHLILEQVKNISLYPLKIGKKKGGGGKKKSRKRRWVKKRTLHFWDPC